MTTFEDLDIAIDRACYQRMIEKDDLAEYKRLHQLYRMWITADLRRRYGVRSWKKIHPVDFEDALKYIQNWPRKFDDVPKGRR